MHSKLGLTLAVLLGGSLSAVADDGAYKEFKAWQVSCSQTQSCSMRQYIADSPLSGFELQRRGGPETPVSLVLSASDSAITADADGLEVVLSIDGGQPLTISGDDVTVDTTSSTLTLSGDFISNGLIDSLKNGTTAAVQIKAGETSVSVEVPLAGAAASLLFIDEYQKRVGHTDALSAKGDKAPNPPLPIKDIRTIAELPGAIRAQFQEGGACADTEPLMLEGNAMSHTLDENTTLYVTPCGSTGAYNAPFQAFIDSFDMVTTLAFPAMLDGAPSATPQAFNLSYDYETKTFSSFFKGRGIGDCGTFSKWKFGEGSMGTQLVLVEETFRDCPAEFSENETIDPSEWPKTWPIK